MSEAWLRLIGMCREDSETGCWVWLGGFGGALKSSPVFHFPGSRHCRRSMPAYKAAWLMSGKQVQHGHWVYRRCLNNACVNPEHCATGTPKQVGAFRASTGVWKHRPERMVASRRNNMIQATPRETVALIESLLALGRMRKDISAEVGVCKDIVTEVAKGRHVNCSKSIGVVRGASIFAL